MAMERCKMKKSQCLFSHGVLYLVVAPASTECIACRFLEGWLGVTFVTRGGQLELPTYYVSCWCISLLVLTGNRSCYHHVRSGQLCSIPRYLDASHFIYYPTATVEGVVVRFCTSYWQWIESDWFYEQTATAAEHRRYMIYSGVS